MVSKLKTSFLIRITMPSFLDVDNNKLLYYLQSLTVEHFQICFYMGSRTLLQIILMAFFFYFVNMPLNYSKFEVNVLGAE